MSANTYSVDMRDIRFVLFEQLDLVDVMSRFERFRDFDRAMYEQMLEEAEKIAVEVIAPTNRKGDVAGCRFDGHGNVTTPPGLQDAWKVMGEGGWMATAADPEYGGLGVPHTLDVALNEIFTGANMAFATYPGLARGAANLLAEFAPDAFRKLACEKLYSGEWCGTMCLTEAGAGSDVGASRTRATPSKEPDVYLLEGEKVFITGGDHDLAGNIVHLVLARTPGAPEGTRGLSIFMVPKFLFDAEGNLGERNGIWVEGIEEKMGLHCSATCTLSLGARGPCRGWLLGKENEGIKIMFHMMNEARIGVGIQGLAGAAAAHNYAKAYARERVQGPAVERMGEPGAPSVTINHHPNVRRMLMWQRVHVDLMRAMVYETAMVMDKALNTDDPNEQRAFMGHVELMTPIVKAYCSDRGFDATVLGVQIFGGYGYTGEYPVEQLARDTKISSIYEGTNGIQAMDLLGRKMRKGSGILFMNWLAWLNEELDRCRGIPELAEGVAGMERARDALGESAMHLGGLALQGKVPTAMLYAMPFLEQFGCVVLGYHALVQGRIALARLAAGTTGDDEIFYKGKVINAKFYTANILPRSVSLGSAVLAADDTALDPILFQ